MQRLNGSLLGAITRIWASQDSEKTKQAHGYFLNFIVRQKLTELVFVMGFELIYGFAALAEKRGVKVLVLSRKQVREVFFAEGMGSKDSLAEILVERFPDELGARLPRKRRTSTSEDHRMAMFEAVALALAFRPYRQLTEA